MKISIQFVTFMFNNASRYCNFSHSQLCQTVLFHFSLTLVAQLRCFNSASRDCNFSHSQLCQTALFHFSLTLVTQLRYYLYKSVLLLSSSTLLFRYERINFLSITSNDSFLVYFVFYNYGFASFHVQYFISLSFDFLLLSTHCFQNIDFASFLVHIKGVFSCVSRNKTHLKAHKCLFLRLKDIFASAIGVL